nr:hypothetical protein CFP56_13126 [Quercus suber]
MVKLSSILTFVALVSSIMTSVTAVHKLGVRYKVDVNGFDNRDCFGKHLPITSGPDHNKFKGIRTKPQRVVEGRCTSWPRRVPFVGMRFVWHRPFWWADGPEGYGKCNLTLFEDEKCQGTVLWEQAKANDMETLRKHACHGPINGTVKSGTIRCNPMAWGMFDIRTKTGLPLVPRPTLIVS